MKYRRATNQYRSPQDRLKDWGEVYNHKGVMKGLRKQAARCMDCGVPFCQSDHGCPLGNIIPKWNDLVFRVSVGLHFFIAPKLPSQCYSNGPGNLGNLGSSKEIQDQ